MILGTRYICDSCGASIGSDRFTLHVKQDAASDDNPAVGWIAHYHPECYGDVSDRIFDAARQIPRPASDSVAALNAIPVAHANVIAGLRRHHRTVDGKTFDEMEREQRRAVKARWRCAARDERDSIVLDALGDKSLALWPLYVALDACVTSETLRSHLKSMTSRGLLSQDTEKPDRGRSRMCWSATAKARSEVFGRKISPESDLPR